MSFFQGICVKWNTATSRIWTRVNKFYFQQREQRYPPPLSVYVCMYLSNPSTRVGFGTRSVFDRILTGLNQSFPSPRPVAIPIAAHGTFSLLESKSMFRPFVNIWIKKRKNSDGFFHVTEVFQHNLLYWLRHVELFLYWRGNPCFAHL